MTALETYVADKERNENVKKVRSKIDELGIEYIYFQFISVTGRIVGTKKNWQRLLEHFNALALLTVFFQ